MTLFKKISFLLMLSLVCQIGLVEESFARNSGKGGKSSKGGKSKKGKNNKNKKRNNKSTRTTTQRTGQRQGTVKTGERTTGLTGNNRANDRTRKIAAGGFHHKNNPTFDGSRNGGTSTGAAALGVAAVQRNQLEEAALARSVYCNNNPTDTTCPNYVDPATQVTTTSSSTVPAV
jgi:hypothetical protein